MGLPYKNQFCFTQCLSDHDKLYTEFWRMVGNQHRMNRMVRNCSLKWPSSMAQQGRHPHLAPGRLGDIPILPLDDCTFVLGLTKADKSPSGSKSKFLPKLQKVQQLGRWREGEPPSSKRPVSAHPISGCSSPWS